MAYVAEFEHDVFVSYATVDDHPAQNGWVAAFVERLSEEVNAVYGLKAINRVWWDRTHIDEEENLPQQIRKSIQASSCLVVILSKGYVLSKWCRAERDAFFQARHVKTNPDGLIFLVDIGNLPIAEKPVELHDIRGRFFWQNDKTATDDGHRVPIGHPVPRADNPAHQLFFSEVKRLAEAIANRTRRLAIEIDRFGTVEKLTQDLYEAVKSVSVKGFQLTVTETGYENDVESRSDFCRWLVHNCSLVTASFALNEVLEKCDGDDIDRVGTVLDCLLPLRYCEDLAKLQESLKTSTLRLIEQRAGDAPIAEIIMAGVDCRPVDCVVRTGRDERLIGRTALEILHAPETGPEDQVWNVEYVLRDIVQQFALEFQKYDEKGLGTVQSLATKLKGWLNPYSHQKKRTVYGLVKLPAAGPQRTVAVACLQEVCNLVPKLVFVEIVSRVDEADQHEASILHVIRRRQTFRKR